MIWRKSLPLFTACLLCAFFFCLFSKTANAESLSTVIYPWNYIDRLGLDNYEQGETAPTMFGEKFKISTSTNRTVIAFELPYIDDGFNKPANSTATIEICADNNCNQVLASQTLGLTGNTAKFTLTTPILLYANTDYYIFLIHTGGLNFYTASYPYYTPLETYDGYGHTYNFAPVGIMSLNYYYDNSPPPPSPDILAFGYPYLWSNPTIFQKNQQKVFPIYWNSCSDYNKLNKVMISANLNGTPDPAPKGVILPKNIYGDQDCKGNLEFSDNTTNFDTTATGTVNFTLTEYDSSDNVIATSTSNTITYTTNLSVNYIDSAMTNPLLIDLGSLPMGIQTATSTTLFFIYNFTNLDTTSGSVSLWDYSNSTSTGYSYTGTLSTSSVQMAGIIIPTPTINTNKTYRFIANLPNASNFQSGLFTVNWSFTPTPTLKCSPPNYDLTRICEGLDVSYNFFGFPSLGAIQCGLKYGLQVSALFIFSPNCDSLNYFQSSYSTFKKAFPFNAFFQLTDSIDTAITTASSTATAGSFSIPFIHSTGSIYMLSIMSESSMSNAIGSSNYSTYRLTIGFIYWLLGALIVYFTVRKI